MKPVCRSIIIGLALCLFASVAPAQPMADRMPPDALVYVGWSPNASMQDTAAARMLADQRVVAPWRAILNEIFIQTGEVPASADEVLPLLKDVMQCEGCFAMLDLNVQKRKITGQSVVVINLAARKAEFEKQFQPIHQRLKDRLGDRVQMMKLENSWLWVEADHKDRPRFVWGFVGDLFVAYWGQNAETFLPTLVGAKPEKSLKNSPAFVNAMAKLPGESIVTTFIGGPAARDVLTRMLVDESYSPFHDFKSNWDQVLLAAGLDDLQSIVEKTVVTDGHFITRTLAHTATRPHGLMSLLDTPPVEDSALAVIPPDAYAVAAWRLDLSKLYEQVKTAARLIDPHSADRTFEQIEEDVKNMGLPLKDILDPVGDQWVIYNAPSTGGFILTGWTLVGTVDDPQRFGRSLETLGKMLADDLDGTRGGAIREFDSDGVTIHYVDSTGGIPFSGSWAVVGDRFIVALYPQLVEDAVRQLKQKENILQDERFIAARTRVAQAGGPLVYVSNPRIVRDVYPLALVIVSAFRAFDRSMVPGDLLPSMQRLLSYVGGDAMSIHVTDDGILRTQTIDNPLLSPLTITTPGLWAAVFLPAMLQENTATDQMSSASHLRQIGQGLLLYSNENRGKYPPDLKALLTTQELTADVLHSPFSEDPASEDMVYLYYEGMDQNLNAEIVVAYDGAALLSEGATNVLYGNGHVQWITFEEFRRSLETSRNIEPRSATIAPDSPAGRMFGTSEAAP
jgi:hypothetical protein